jgi:hypothetical protein
LITASAERPRLMSRKYFAIALKVLADLLADIAR